LCDTRDGDDKSPHFPAFLGHASFVLLDEAVAARGDDVQSVRSNGKSVFLFCNLSSCEAGDRCLQIAALSCFLGHARAELEGTILAMRVRTLQKIVAKYKVAVRDVILAFYDVSVYDDRSVPVNHL